jgi:hypothetical protein
LDGSGVSNYLSNANCTWIIAPPAVLAISIRFTELSTQLNKDFVRVFQCSDVACTQQQLLAELSGVYTMPQDVTSSTGYMKVVFTSDSSVNYDGFNASWNSVCLISLIGFHVICKFTFTFVLAYVVIKAHGLK